MGKKRKADANMDLERGLYCSFVAAANSISQLYTQASAQQRQSRDAGARAALVSHLNICWHTQQPVIRVAVPTTTTTKLL